MEQLKKEDPENEILTAVGHGYDVTKDTTPGEKISHKYGIVGSLKKCHDWKEYPKNMKSTKDVYASLKLDGLSVVLYYEEGNLVKALTRGSNNIGIDVTEFASYILREDIHIGDEMFTGAVRGEIIMSYADFERFKEIHPEAENPRNSAAGLKNSNKITSDLDFLDIVVYSVIGSENLTFTTYPSMMKWLENNFSYVVSWSSALTYEVLNEENFDETMYRFRDTWYNKYPADGIVLSSSTVHTNNDFSLNWDAVAYKFKAESAVTSVMDVEWNLSKTKYLIPRIKVETVRLSGTNVSYCTGHNAEFISNNKIGPGAEVKIYKSGEIIPYLDEVITPSESCMIPNALVVKAH